MFSEGVNDMELRKERIHFADREVEIFSPVNGETMDVFSLLQNPEEFHGDTNVHNLFRFHDLFEPLIGKYDGFLGEWNPDTLPDMGIVVLEHYYDEAGNLMDEIDELAQQAIIKPKLYDDIPFCREYFYLADAGYKLLLKYQGDFEVGDTFGTPVSLERAGLPSTRLAMGLDTDAIVEDELRVVTKRTHLKGDNETHLSVTAKWRDKEALDQIAGQNIMVCDFVNPASGASVAALALGALYNGAKPKSIEHRSISLTQQGALFNHQAFDDLGIRTTFMSVGVANELNEMYYLVGERSVGDAGHFLRHFLPTGYVQ